MDKLRFTPYAWAKMVFLRDHGKTEVSFYALTDKDDISLVRDVFMVPQRCSMAFTEFKDEGIADFFDKMVDAGYQIENFARIWCHTHPGPSASPSGTDENTFREAFGNNHWAIMFILGTTGNTTCRLRYKMQPVSPKFPVQEISKELPVHVAFDTIFPATNREAWVKEYNENWEEKTYTSTHYGSGFQQGSNLYNGGHAPAGSSCYYGPGWRLSSKGNWILTQKQKEEDEKNGVKISPDYAAWAARRNHTRSDNFQPLLPFTGAPNSRQLSRRERKYLRKNGSLDGFVSPVNDGTKNVKLEHLETNRGLLTEQTDDGFAWMDNAIHSTSKEKGELENFWVKIDTAEYIPEQWRGRKVKNVWAKDAIEATQLVHARLGIPPFRGKLTIGSGADAHDVYVPAPEEILDPEPDTVLADETDNRTAEEIADDLYWEGIDKELCEIYRKEDEGILTMEERKELEDAIFAEEEFDRRADALLQEAEKKQDSLTLANSVEDLTLLPLEEETATNEGLANFYGHHSDFGAGIYPDMT